MQNKSTCTNSELINYLVHSDLEMIFISSSIFFAAIPEKKKTLSIDSSSSFFRARFTYTYVFFI